MNNSAALLGALSTALAVLLVPLSSSATEAESLRFVTLNAAFTDMKELSINDCDRGWPAKYTGDVDYNCRVEHLAPRLIAGNYDVIVLNEVFAEEAKQLLFVALKPYYPHVIYRLEGKFASEVRDDSGLMLFSKWPFVDPPVNLDSVLGATEAAAQVISSGISQSGTAASGKVAFREFLSAATWDVWATKGVGYVRLQSPSGKKYSVFFTHLQASYADYDYCDNEFCGPRYIEIMNIRTAQLYAIREFQQMVAPVPVTTAEQDVYVLAGDMNINGDLSNPRFAGVASSNNKHSRWEYDSHFDLTLAADDPPGDPSGNFFRTFFRDSWAAYMTAPGCLGHEATDPFAPNCPAEQIYYGHTGFDQGFTYKVLDGFDGDQRLDYVFLASKYLGSSMPSEVPEHEMCATHVTKAYNLFATSDEKGEGSEGGIRGARVGWDPTSDHIGLNAEINRCVQWGAPSYARTVDIWAPVQGTFEYAGATKWLKVNEPGTYAFQAVPIGTSAELKFWVYAPTDLSRPVEPYHGENQYSPAVPGHYEVTGAWIEGQPAFTGSKLVLPEAPFYIKVWSNMATDFELYSHKNRCASVDDSCAIEPYDSYLYPEGARRTWIGLSPDESFFEFHVARADMGATQNAYQMLNLYAAQVQQGYIESMEVLRRDAQGQWNVLPYFTKQSSGATQDTAGKWNMKFSATGADPSHLDPQSKADERYMLRLRRSQALVSSDGGPPPDFDYWVGWDTNLTWMYGSDLGGTALTIKCDDQQEWSEDEIWMRVEPDGDLSTYTCWESPNTPVWEVSGHFDDETDYWVSWEGAWQSSSAHTSWGEPYGQTKAYKFVDHVRMILYEDDYGDSCVSDDERASCIIYASDLPKQARPITMNGDPWHCWNFHEGTYTGWFNFAHSSPSQYCNQVGDPACQAPNVCDVVAHKCTVGN